MNGAIAFGAEAVAAVAVLRGRVPGIGRGKRGASEETAGPGSSRAEIPLTR